MALSSLEVMLVEKDGRRMAAVDRARVPDVSAAEGMFAGFIGKPSEGVKWRRQVYIVCVGCSDVCVVGGK